MKTLYALTLSQYLNFSPLVYFLIFYGVFLKILNVQRVNHSSFLLWDLVLLFCLKTVSHFSSNRHFSVFSSNFSVILLFHQNHYMFYVYSGLIVVKFAKMATLFNSLSFSGPLPSAVSGCSSAHEEVESVYPPLKSGLVTCSDRQNQWQ